MRRHLTYAKKFDKYEGNIELSEEEIDAASRLVVLCQHLHPPAAPLFTNVGIKRTTSKILNLVEFSNLTFENERSCKWVPNVKFIPLVPAKLKDDIRFAHTNVRLFAEAQKATLKDIECEVVPGLVAGQKSIPVRAAACYVPGALFPYRFCNHDGNDGQSCRLRAYRGLFAAPPGSRHSTGDHISGPDLWCRQDIGSWRGARGGCHGLRSVRSAQSRYPGGSRQSVRRRGQTDIVWPCRHRHVCRPDRQP